MYGCGYTYCPVCWGTELLTQPAHSVFHPASVIFSGLSVERESSSICAQANLGIGGDLMTCNETSQASLSFTALELQWYLYSNMAAKDRQIGSTNIPLSCCDVLSFYTILIRRKHRSFKSHFAICFTKLKWLLKVVKSWNHVMLVWLPVKLKSKKQMKGSFCYNFCFIFVAEVLICLSNGITFRVLYMFAYSLYIQNE